MPGFAGLRAGILLQAVFDSTGLGSGAERPGEVGKCWNGYQDPRQELPGESEKTNTEQAARRSDWPCF